MRFNTVDEATVTEQDMEAAKKKLKRVKSGSQVSFTHHKHGEVTGTYHGMGRMGGRSYAKVDHPKHGLTYVPVHQVKHGTNESVEQVDEAGGLYRSPPLGSDHDTRVVSGGYRDKDGKYHPPKTRASMQRDNASRKADIRKKTLAAFRNENYVIKHKKTKQVLNTHSDEASARDEHRGLGKDAADYGVYKQTKKDASARSKLNRGSMKS